LHFDFPTFAKPKTVSGKLPEQNFQRQMTENIKIIQTTELNEQAKQQVFDLWNNEYPENLSYNNLTEFVNTVYNSVVYTKNNAYLKQCFLNEITKMIIFTFGVTSWC
jgi:hypothetical protein